METLLSNIPVLLCAAASTIAFVSIAQSTDCAPCKQSNNMQKWKLKGNEKWKGVGGGDSKSLTLNDDNINSVLDNLKTNGHIAIVKFYATWCGHCKDLAPEWEKFAASINEKCSTIKAYHCEESDLGYCQQHLKKSIDGFPTIRLMRYDPQKQEIIEQDFEGERSYSGLIRFVKDSKVVHDQCQQSI